MWVNEWTRSCFADRIYSFSHESFMADRMGLVITGQHYVTLPGSTVSLHRPVHSKITVTCTLTWQTDCWRALYTLENGFRSITKSQGGLFLSFAQTFFALIDQINCQNGVPLSLGGSGNETRSHYSTASCTVNYATTGVAHQRSAYAQLSPLYHLCHSRDAHVMKCTRPSPAFPYCKWRKAGQGLEQGYSNSWLHVHYQCISIHLKWEARLVTAVGAGFKYWYKWCSYLNWPQK